VRDEFIYPKTIWFCGVISFTQYSDLENTENRVKCLSLCCFASSWGGRYCVHHLSRTHESEEKMMSEENTRRLTCANCGAPLAEQIDDADILCAHCGKDHVSIVPPPPECDLHIQTGDAVAVKWGTRWWPARIIEHIEEHLFLVHYEGWGPAFDEEVDTARIRAFNESEDAVQGRGISASSDIVSKRTAGAIKGSLVLFVIIIAITLGGYFLMPLIENLVNKNAKHLKEQDKADVSSMLHGIKVPAYARPVLETDHLKPNQKVFVLLENGWHPGEIISVMADGSVRVRYIDWHNTVDETVSRNRLRILE
jgi:hypothetical protein